MRAAWPFLLILTACGSGGDGAGPGNRYQHVEFDDGIARGIIFDRRTGCVAEYHLPNGVNGLPRGEQFVDEPPEPPEGFEIDKPNITPGFDAWFCPKPQVIEEDAA